MSDIVHVACKLPSGVRIGELNMLGTSYKLGEEEKPELVGGYRITMNVPEAEWDEWRSRMKDSSLVTGKIVMADGNLATLRKMCRDNATAPAGVGAPMKQPN